MVILPALLLFFLSICSLLQFHIHFRAVFSISVTNEMEILIGTGLDL